MVKTKIKNEIAIFTAGAGWAARDSYLENTLNELTALYYSTPAPTPPNLEIAIVKFCFEFMAGEITEAPATENIAGKIY